MPLSSTLPLARRGLRVPALAAVLIAGFVAGAGAQDAEPAMTLDEVRNCMCLEREMTARKDEMDLRSGILDERQDELQRLQMDIEVNRASMDPQDEEAIATLKSMIAREQDLRELLRRDILPSYRSSVSAYNAAAAAYNESCAGRRLFRTDVERLQDTLQCPAMP